MGRQLVKLPVVEYPDGASGDLVREMKESDDSLLVENQERRKRSVRDFPTTPRPMTMRRQGPLVQPAETVVEGGEVSRREVSSPEVGPASEVVSSPTPRCPACMTGMKRC